MSLFSHSFPVGPQKRGNASADTTQKNLILSLYCFLISFPHLFSNLFVFPGHLASLNLIIYLTPFSSNIHHLLALTCSWVTGMRRCLESSLRVLTSVLMSSLQPTSTTLAFGQNSCVSPCHCRNVSRQRKNWKTLLIMSNMSTERWAAFAEVQRWPFGYSDTGYLSLREINALLLKDICSA